MKSIVLVIFAVLAFAACASLKSEGSAAFRVECNVPEAAVLLDDQVACWVTSPVELSS